jgi:dethiobiotin synthetase
MRGLFVTGTDTGVGKTILSVALLGAMAAEGERVRAHKPVVTGLESPPDFWPPEHELLGWAAGMAPKDVAPLRFGPAVAPHLAAALAGTRIEAARLISNAANALHGNGDREKGDAGVLVVDGVGGLLTPLAADFSVRHLACALGLPVVIAARPGLGTISHTLLTLEAARAAGLRVSAVVLTPWPRRPSALERSNRETIAHLGEVDVHTLGSVRPRDIAALARMGVELPWRSWTGTARGAMPLRLAA